MVNSQLWVSKYSTPGSGMVLWNQAGYCEWSRSLRIEAWSCASCHTQNPLAAGKHASTGKRIAPLAPAANAERFSDARAVDKWFRRNCNDVLGRECTAKEKGDVLQYLMSLR